MAFFLIKIFIALGIVVTLTITWLLLKPFISDKKDDEDRWDNF